MQTQQPLPAESTDVREDVFRELLIRWRGFGMKAAVHGIAVRVSAFTPAFLQVGKRINSAIPEERPVSPCGIEQTQVTFCMQGGF